MQDLWSLLWYVGSSSLTRDWAWAPLFLEHRILATGWTIREVPLYDFSISSGPDAFIFYQFHDSESHLVEKLTLCTHLSAHKGENHLLHIPWVPQIPACRKISFPFSMEQYLGLLWTWVSLQTLSWPTPTPLTSKSSFFYVLSQLGTGKWTERKQWMKRSQTQHLK